MRATDQKGVAILAALGVLTILGIFSSVFLAHMKLEAAYAARDAQDLKVHYLAVAGVEDAIARLEADSPSVDSHSDAWWFGESPELTPLGEGGYTVTVTDESARINVLTASPQMLSAILGGANEEVAKAVNYRSSVRLFTVESLASAGLGADALSRVRTLGTTLGDGKVNINTANADVLAALPGMDTKAAQLVIEFRKGADGVEGTEDDFVFSAPRDLTKVPGFESAREASVKALVKTNSSFFRVEAVGKIYRGARVVGNKRIVAVLYREDNRNVSIRSWESS